MFLVLRDEGPEATDNKESSYGLVIVWLFGFKYTNNFVNNRKKYKCERTLLANGLSKISMERYYYTGIVKYPYELKARKD